MKFEFDHTYSIDKNFAFREKLGAAGFFLNSREAIHPGDVHCKFIPFFNSKLGYHYLEFVHLGKKGTGSVPGLSMIGDGGLESFAKSAKGKRLKIHFMHRNYDWQNGEDVRRAGWNYGTFPKHKSKIHFWITEYEPRKNSPRSRKRVDPHPNGAKEIAEIALTLSASDLKFYSAMFGKPKDGKWIFKKTGFVFSYELGKTSRVNAIVVKTSNLDKMIRNFSWDELTVHNGQVAARIKHPNKKMWDVLLIQG